jgi:hypothetical protein
MTDEEIGAYARLFATAVAVGEYEAAEDLLRDVFDAR